MNFPRGLDSTRTNPTGLELTCFMETCLDHIFDDDDFVYLIDGEEVFHAKGCFPMWLLDETYLIDLININNTTAINEFFRTGLRDVGGVLIKGDPTTDEPEILYDGRT